MTICKPNDIKLHISSGEKLLGLDIGKKTIGLALSDASLKIASPVKILHRRKFTTDMAHLLEYTDSQSVGGLVLGWPVNMDGSPGPRCDSVRDFAHALLKVDQHRRFHHGITFRPVLFGAHPHRWVEEI